jgi:hypothetical protein
MVTCFDFVCVCVLYLLLRKLNIFLRTHESSKGLLQIAFVVSKY